jgi:hypothetical protein
MANTLKHFGPDPNEEDPRTEKAVKSRLSRGQVDRAIRGNVRDFKAAGVDPFKFYNNRGPGKSTLTSKEVAKLNATKKAKRILAASQAKKRGASAVSGLKKAPTKSDDERSRAKKAIDYKRKLNKGGY